MTANIFQRLFLAITWESLKFFLIIFFLGGYDSKPSSLIHSKIPLQHNNKKSFFSNSHFNNTLLLLFHPQFHFIRFFMSRSHQHHVASKLIYHHASSVSKFILVFGITSCCVSPFSAINRRNIHLLPFII